MSEVTVILNRLADRLGEPLDAPVPLDGGITNRNFRARFASGDYVIRLPGKYTELLGIDRTAERLAAERAAALGLGPELVYADADCLVTVYLAASPLSPGDLGRDPAPAGRALRRFHDCGLELPKRFWVPELLGDYESLVRRRGGRVPAAFTRAQQIVGRVAEALPLLDPVPCHDDLLPGNLLVTPDGLLLVDWEYAGMGHRFFDLGNLAVNNDLDEATEGILLQAYTGAPPTRGGAAALRLMRIVSDAREAAWGVLQGLISELDFDFADYAARHFERMVGAAAEPRFTEWLDAAAA